jgi:hypothetical protein
MNSSSCSHIRFRAEPFQILTLSLNKTSTTLERIISQLTKIEIVKKQIISFIIQNKIIYLDRFNILFILF